MKHFISLILFYVSLIQHYIGMIVFYIILIQNYIHPIQKSAEEYFSTRELAVLILIFASTSLLGVTSKDIRNAAIVTFRDVFIIRNSRVGIIIIAYFGCILAFFWWGHSHRLWGMNLLGSLFFWTFSSSIVILFSFFDPKVKHPIKNALTNSLGWTTIIIFVAGIYTLPLWIEIVLLIILSVLTIIMVMTRDHPELNSTPGGLILVKYTSQLIVAIFLIELAVSLFALTENENDSALIIGKFLLPIIMTFFALVFTCTLWVCAQYEDLFSRICIKNGQQYLQLHFKLAIISICWLNMKKISTFRSMNIGSRRFNQGRNFIDARTILTTAKREKHESLPQEDYSDPAQGIFPLNDDGNPKYSAVTFEYPQGRAFVEGFRDIFPHFPEEMYRKNSRFLLRIAQVVSTNLQAGKEPLTIIRSVKSRIEYDLKNHNTVSEIIVSEADAMKVFNLTIDTVCPEFIDRKL